MKISFSGKRLKKYQKYNNIFFDTIIPEHLLTTNDFQSFFKQRLKEFEYRRLDFNNAYIIILHHGDFNILRIRNMNNFRKIAKAYNVNDIEFLHNYLVNNTGSGRLVFPAGSFEKVKSIYS